MQICTLLGCIVLGKDAKRAILLAEETQSDIESAFYKEAVAKKYASFFQSTLHHNNGYFLQVFKTIIFYCCDENLISEYVGVTLISIKCATELEL